MAKKKQVKKLPSNYEKIAKSIMKLRDEKGAIDEKEKKLVKQLKDTMDTGEYRGSSVDVTLVLEHRKQLNSKLAKSMLPASVYKKLLTNTTFLKLSVSKKRAA